MLRIIGKWSAENIAARFFAVAREGSILRERTVAGTACQARRFDPELGDRLLRKTDRYAAAN